MYYYKIFASHNNEFIENYSACPKTRTQSILCKEKTL